jgi:hypothetical protein
MDSSKRSREMGMDRDSRASGTTTRSTRRKLSTLLLATAFGIAAANQAASAFDVTGRISTGSGTALAGVTVTLRSGATTKTVTTDWSGSYAATGLANGSWTVRPSKASTFFAPESIFLYAQTRNASIDFVSGSPTASLTGIDVGPVLASGSTYVSGPGVVMVGRGPALGSGENGMDAFHFYNKSVVGDGDLIAKVGNLTGGGQDAQVGIMLRENLSANSRFTALVFRPHQPGAGDHVMSISRVTKGSGAPAGGCHKERCNSVDASKPIWLRIHRQVNDFLFYWSTDGAGWIYVGSSTVAMAQNLLAGAVLVGPDSTSTQATVEQLSFAPNATPKVVVSSSANSVAVGNNLTLTATATDPDGTISSVQFFVNGSRVGISSMAPYQAVWNTLGLSAGNYLLTAKVTDDKGAYGYSIQKTIALTGGAVAARPVALLVAKSTTLAGGDLILGDRLNALGFTVVVKTDAAAAATDTAGKALVVLAPSASAANVGIKFRAVKKPVLVANPALYAKMSMTGSVQNTDWGFAASKDSLNLIGCRADLLDWSVNGGVNRDNGVGNCHELTAALFGKRQVQAVRGNIAWAKPAASAKVAASLDTDPAKASIFSYDAGAVMASNFAAPGRRAGIWLDTASAKSISDAGRTLLDASVYWAAQLRKPITKKVMVINYEPILATRGGQPMHVYKGWVDPHEMAREYLSDLTEASGGYLRWQLVDFKDVNGMPPNYTGFQWTESKIIGAIDSAKYPPGGADYNQIIATYGIDSKVRAGQLDEVVMYGPGGAGFDESRMAGQNPYYINGDITYLPNTPNFAIMGLNSERGTGEALESFSHRVEATMSNTFGWAYSDCEGYPDFRLRTAWEQFATNNKTVVVGQPTGMGNAHYSPVSPEDYDWNARWYLPDGPWVTANTYADDWAANYPYFKGTTNIVDTRTWDPQTGTEFSLNDRGFKRWWLGHMPRVLGNNIDGTLEKRRETVAANGTGFSNNWWDYMVDFNKRPESSGPQGQSCRESYRTPDVVTGLVATVAGDHVDLVWDAVQGSPDYAIEKSLDGTTWTNVYAIGGPSASVYGLTDGVPVSFRIKAYNAVGSAWPSAAVTVTPGAPVEPCSPATLISGGQSGNFNTTGSVCFKTSSNIVGWGCANFDGRVMKVNGVQMACGQLPVPAAVNGYNYFEATAGTYAWSNFWWW